MRREGAIACLELSIQKRTQQRRNPSWDFLIKQT